MRGCVACPCNYYPTIAYSYYYSTSESEMSQKSVEILFLGKFHPCLVSFLEFVSWLT